ncbi:MAG: hypothetical protein ACOYB3_01995 [Azonexus sp.]
MLQIVADAGLDVEDVLTRVGEDFPSIPHLHRPASPPVVLAERYDHGRRWVTYACEKCGEPLRERQA